MTCRPAGGRVRAVAPSLALLLVCLVLAWPSIALQQRPHPLHDGRDPEAAEQDAFAEAELPVASDPVARALVERARAAFCATSETRHNARCGDADVVIDDPLVLAGPAGPLVTHVVRLDVRASYGMGAVTYLHVSDGSRSVFEEIHSRVLTGMGGISHEAGVVRWEWLAAAEPVLVVQLDQHENDEDMGICERDGSYSSEVFVCVARADGPRCGHAQTRFLAYEEAERPCDSQHARRVSRFRGYEARLRVSGARLSFTRRPGTPQAPPRSLPRRIAIEEFVSQPPSRWPSEAAPSVTPP